MCYRGMVMTSNFDHDMKSQLFLESSIRDHRSKTKDSKRDLYLIYKLEN